MKNFKIIALLLGSNIGAGGIETNLNPTLDDVKVADVSVNIFVNSNVKTLDINRWIKFYPESTLNIWVSDEFVANRDSKEPLFTASYEKFKDGQINILKLESMNKTLEGIVKGVNKNETTKKKSLKYITAISDQLFKEEKCKQALFFDASVFSTDSIDNVSKQLDKYGFACGSDENGIYNDGSALIIQGSRFVDAMKGFLNNSISENTSDNKLFMLAFADVLACSADWYSNVLYINGIDVMITEPRSVNYNDVIKIIYDESRGTFKRKDGTKEYIKVISDYRRDALFCEINGKEVNLTNYRKRMRDLYSKDGKRISSELKIELPLFKCKEIY